MNAPAPSHPYRFLERQPRLGRRVFIHPSAVVSGDVSLGDDVSVWPTAVLRGDVNSIRVGARSNVQDGSILHVTHEGPWAPDGIPLIVGEDVTIGHRALLHACTIGNRCLIGMGAIVMDGAVVESDAMVAAGAIVTPGKVVAAGTLWRGSPASYARDLSAQERENLSYNAAHYARLKDLYRNMAG